MTRFRLADWMVPPVVVPIFLGLLILAAAVLNR
jgi:hypothetical protein